MASPLPPGVTRREAFAKAGLTALQVKACVKVFIELKTYRQAGRSLRMSGNAVGQQINAARKNCPGLAEAFPARSMIRHGRRVVIEDFDSAESAEDDSQESPHFTERFRG